MWSRVDFCLILTGQNLITYFFWSPQTSSQFYWCTRRTHRTQHVFVFCLRFIVKKRIQRKIIKGQRHMGQNPEETSCKLPRALSQLNHTGCASFFQQQIVTTCMTCCLPRKLIKDSVPNVFVGAGHVLLFCMRTYQNFRLPEKKQMFIIKFVFLYSLGMVTYYYPEIWLPRRQPRVNLASRPF